MGDGGGHGGVKLFHADILYCFGSLLEESHQANLQNATNKADIDNIFKLIFGLYVMIKYFWLRSTFILYFDITRYSWNDLFGVEEKHIWPRLWSRPRDSF